MEAALHPAALEFAVPRNVLPKLVPVSASEL